MKAAPFLYTRAESLTQVCQLLAEYGEEAKLLAGGQSLMPILNMRLASPHLLIDINALAELDSIAKKSDSICIGALSRYVVLENSLLIKQHLSLLSLALPYIAHPAIRNRGTLGGSIAFADPAAEIPACALALKARMVLQNSEQQRIVSAEDFFLGLYETALADDEILLAVEFPLPKPASKPFFLELSRRHGDYAMLGLAGQIEIINTVITDIQLVFFGVADKPVVADQAVNILRGRELDKSTLSLAQDALASELDAFADLQASAEMKIHLAQVLLKRALGEFNKQALA